MEPIEALVAANAEFETRLGQVAADQWSLPTPCSEWDVSALVNHMLLGTRMSIQVLDGMDRDRIIGQLDDDMLTDTDDPLADLRKLNEQMVQRFAVQGGLEGMVAHPAGDFPRSMFVGFRIGDSSAHAWDLATAIGADQALRPDLVDYLWETTQPQKDMLAATGMFGSGPSGELGDDASIQDRYLDLIGRRP